MLNHSKCSLLVAMIALLLGAPAALGATQSADAGAQTARHGKRHHGGGARHKPGAIVHRGGSHSVAPATSVLLGNTAVEWQYDTLPNGEAEAFRFQADTSGLAGVMHVYTGASTSASTLVVGLYGDSVSGHPGALLSTGSVAPQPGAWTSVPIAPVELLAGKTYWLAILGKGGWLRYRDRAYGPCPSETSASSSLHKLPSAWASGTEYTDCPISAYVTPAPLLISAKASDLASVLTQATPFDGSSQASSPTPPPPTTVPTATTSPTISGEAVEGQTLAAAEGSWSESPSSYAYRWEDCNAAGEECTGIHGANTASYKVAPSDVGHTIRVVVTAENSVGKGEASSEPTEVVTHERVPANTVAPSVSGTAEEGQTLSASEGSWTEHPTSYAYQWEDCNAAGEACTNIAKATSSTHKLVAGDVGHTIRVVVTASNAGGSGKESSPPTALVTKIKAPENEGLPVVSGIDEVGKTLSATKGSWSGNPTSIEYRWQDCNTSGEACANIGGASISTYKLASGDVGHRVRVVVSASNAGGSTEAASSATSPILEAGTEGTQVFVSQSGAGSQSGEGGCNNAHSLSWLGQGGNWGSGAGKVGPGVTVDLCGTFTEPVETQGGGSSGRPVTIRFMSGAKIAMGGSGCPGSGCINVANKSEYVVIDGGSDGVIENTNRGTKKEKSGAPTTGVMANGCKHCAIENLEIANLYVAEKGDTVGNTEIRGIVVRPEGSTPEDITVSNDVLHDMGWAVNIEAAENTSNIHVEHDTFYHLTHGFTPGASFSGGNVGPIVFAHNHFYGNINWEDGETDTNHVDGVHCFAGNEDQPHYSGLYIYDNYITTEGHNVTGPIFMEGSNGHTPCADKTSKIWIFDNVLTGTSCCGLAGDFAGEPHIFDNTLIGNSKSEEACEVFNSDASVKLVVQNVRFMNNVVTTCRTLLDAEKQLIASGGMGDNLLANAGGGGESLACRGSGAKYYSMGEYSSWRSCMEDGEEHTIVTGEAKLDLKEEVGRLGQPESGSEAIGHGTNLTSLCPETPEEALCENIEGEARPSSGAWNIGAY